jgi:hypothetical protein
LSYLQQVIKETPKDIVDKVLAELPSGLQAEIQAEIHQPKHYRKRLNGRCTIVKKGTPCQTT